MESLPEAIHVHDLISSWDRLKRFAYDHRETALEEWDAEVALEEWDAVLFQVVTLRSVDPLKKHAA
ncbi:MAG TPA: hypothetical protein VJR03_05155 [Nitrospira sp.]|nr:hypothetical protein [Nitrospira sp.]